MATSNISAGSRVAVRQTPSLISAALDRARSSLLPLLFLAGGMGLLIWSMFRPYWHLKLKAPQYPRGLAIDVYVNKIEDLRSVKEIDGLNHYIGMIKLTDAATIERSISLVAIPLVAILAVASIFLAGKWRMVARLPMLLYPAIFVADLFAWLYYAGHNLDSHAALSSSIKAFTPKLYGDGVIGQFGTKANFESGFWLAVGAAALTLVAIVLDRWQRHERTA